jgi:cytochrome c oxidase subunit 3
MASTLTETGRGGLPPIDEGPYGWGGDPGGGGENPNPGAARKTSLIGLYVMMCASVMTFAALASAVVVRRGLGNDWTSMPLPWILWPNTAVLLASSVFLDIARRLLRRSHRVAFNWLWSIGTLLGAGFLAGQIYAWRQLHQAGVFLEKKPSHAFFYVLTWTHAAHAIVGLAALIFVTVVALRFRLGPRRRTLVDVSTVFWHFLDVLWLLLMWMFVHYHTA